MRNADGAFIAYDITNLQSFKDVEYWFEQIKLSSNDDIIIYLLGNKKDLENKRIIDEKTGKNKAKILGINNFFEVSAKTKENLTEMFNEFYMEIYQKNKSKYIEKQNKNLKAFENLQKQESNSSCC